MTVHNSTGHYSMRIKLALLAGFAWSFTSLAMAAPVLPEGVARSLAIVEAAWVDSLLPEDSKLVPFDEQIFTEISPILDSQESIKLPEDQLLTD